MANSAAKFMCMFLILSMSSQSLATEYLVGGSSGWSSPSVLIPWLSGKVFHLATFNCRIIVFKYLPALHTVAIVDLNSYNSCHLNVIIDLYASLTGETRITLTKTGLLHITSNIGLDCLLGLKIAIDVQV
ncbi:hypothetical protein LIER_07340 [Lithospermum erythrorhizon]|uniref:Phytocyanin domain-containing protein n=1 Tax=Lithospermum erythrorhizon TaxID=34254 RepID=A0AAV3P894_LITER